MSETAADLRALAETDVAQPLPANKTQSTLVNPPFIYVPGTFNTRDLGLVPSSDGMSNTLRKGFAYRSGALTGLTDNGKAVLAGKLGVKKIFDLRSLEEHNHGPDPEIAGVQNVWVATTELAVKVDIGDFIEGQGENGYKKMYLDVLNIYQPSFKAVLEHVRDNPQEPFLFHCTAGRDRTGVLAGMLLTLAGAESNTVSLDFLLSRVGTEPAREQLVAFARKGSGVESNDAPGFRNLCNLKAACWNAFLDGMRLEYDSFDKYVTNTLGFSGHELATIKKNLVVLP